MSKGAGDRSLAKANNSLLLLRTSDELKVMLGFRKLKNFALVTLEGVALLLKCTEEDAVGVTLGKRCDSNGEAVLGDA